MAERIEDKIRNLLLPIITGEGLELVRIRLTGAAGRATLQIMAERPDGTMDIGACEILSRQFSLLLDTYDVLTTAYTLEVSSPGIDRPLTRLKDYERWCGFETNLNLKEKLNGRKRFKGKFDKPFEKDGVHHITFTDHNADTFEFPIDAIQDAQLTLSDELLKFTQNGAKLHGLDIEQHGDLEDQGIEVSYEKETSKKRGKKSVHQEEPEQV